MSTVNPSVVMLDLLEARVRRRNNAVRRRASLVIGVGLLVTVIVLTFDPTKWGPVG